MRFFQIIFKLLFSFRHDFTLTKASLPETSNQYKESDDNGMSIFFNKQNNGIANAAYGNRFVMLPFDYFSSIFLKKAVSELTTDELKELCTKNNIASYYRNPKEFVQELNKWKLGFLEAYNNLKSINSKTLTAIDEEIFHNNHLNNTSQWNTSQSITVLYRLVSTYLTYHRDKISVKIAKEPKHLEITALLLNSFFIRQLLAINSTNLAEAYCHYKDEDIEELKYMYNNITYKYALDYLEMHRFLENKFPGREEEVLALLSKKIFDYPFAYQICKHTGLSYNEFRDFYTMLPKRRFEELKKIILQDENSSCDELTDRINTCFSKHSSFEERFASNILFYATSKIVPTRLIKFILWQVFFTKYWQVFQLYIEELFRGGKKFNSPYKNFPAIRTYGFNDEFFNIDPGLNLFKNSRAFLIAQNSLEPTLAGDDGYTSIYHSKKCIPLLIQATFLKALYWNCEIKSSLEDFIVSFEFLYRVRPFMKTHRFCFEETLLPLFFNESNKLAALFRERKRASQEPFDLVFCRDFELSMERLIAYVTNMDDETQSKFLAFCELNYLHGF